MHEDHKPLKSVDAEQVGEESCHRGMLHCPGKPRLHSLLHSHAKKQEIIQIGHFSVIRKHICLLHFFQ